MKKLKQPLVTNSKGEVIKLTKKEQSFANYMQRQVNERFENALGYEVSITTLTAILKKVSEQKYYQIAPAEYIPVKVGEGTWHSNLTAFRSFQTADLFESGIVNTGSSNDRLSVADAGVDALNIKINNWGKEISWSIFDLEQAAVSGNWDLVSAKERSRRENWDLGIQRVAFLGARGQNGSSGSCLGLLNQPSVTVDTTTITTSLSAMTYTQLATFQQNVIQKYRANCNYTAFPTHFAIPELDYNGLAAQSSPQFPIKSTLQLLEEGFKVITRNPNFKILPLVYCSVANAGSGILPSAFATQMYCLYKYDETSGLMNIPLDYTNSLASSINNFNFQNAGYGQFTGYLALRPAEHYYMGF